MSRREEEMQAMRQIEKEKEAGDKETERFRSWKLQLVVCEIGGGGDWDCRNQRSEPLRELGHDCIRPVRTKARHIERRHDPFRFAQVVPSDANDFQDGKPLRAEPKNLMRKACFHHSLVKFINEIGFLRRAKQR